MIAYLLIISLYNIAVENIFKFPSTLNISRYFDNKIEDTEGAKQIKPAEH